MQLVGYTHVGDAEMPNGEMENTSGKVGGRKSGDLAFLRMSLTYSLV